MSFEVYKLIHFLGIFSMVTALVATSAQAAPEGGTCDKQTRTVLRLVHGGAVFLILVGGFGMLARKGVLGAGEGLPNWVLLKLGIWLALALAMGVAHRRGVARVLLIGVPALVLLAGAIVLYQPL